MDCTLRGGSGETTCFQFMSSSWTAWSTDYVGYVMPKTEGNARYLATLRVSDLLNQGHSAEDMFKIWNQGNTGECIRGINKYNVAYDSCAYVKKAMMVYNR